MKVDDHGGMWQLQRRSNRRCAVEVSEEIGDVCVRLGLQRHPLGIAGRIKETRVGARPVVVRCRKVRAEVGNSLGNDLEGVLRLEPHHPRRDVNDPLRPVGQKVDQVISVLTLTAKVEGEGHWRRLVLLPEKPAAIPKKQVMPDYDDEEEDE